MRQILINRVVWRQCNAAVVVVVVVVVALAVVTVAIAVEKKKRRERVSSLHKQQRSIVKLTVTDKRVYISFNWIARASWS